MNTSFFCLSSTFWSYFGFSVFWLVSRDKPSKCSTINLEHKVTFCLLKWGQISSQKETKCYSINFFLLWCHSLKFKPKSKKTFAIHMTEAIKDEWNIYTVCPSVECLSRIANTIEKEKSDLAMSSEHGQYN